MSERKSISAFFPAYNDGGTIASMVITVLLTLQELTDDYEVIVVNDGSVDYTAEVLDELAWRYERVRVIHHPQNRGYGGALCTGFASATKELIFYTDGDAQYVPTNCTCSYLRCGKGLTWSTVGRSNARIHCTGLLSGASTSTSSSFSSDSN